MSVRDAWHNGLRRARRMAETKYHSLKRFRQTRDSKDPETTFGPEFVAECRRCGCYMIVYFASCREELEEQNLKPEDAIMVHSDTYGISSESYMFLSGNWDRFECGEIKKSR